MNKLKQLRFSLMRSAGIAALIVVAAGALMAGTGMLAEAAAKKKADASAKFSQDQGQLSNITTQISKSGTAEKRYAEIALARRNDDYTANSDAMKTLLRDAKEQFRFGSDFKLTLAPEKGSDKPEFSALNYDVTLREPMRIELSAISDTHFYSFVEHLMRYAPGLVRVTRWQLTREADMDTAALTGMNTGQAPPLVEAAMEFTWVGVAPKKAASPSPVPGSPPGMP